MSTEEQQQQQRRRAVARKLSMGHQRRSAEDSRYADEQQFQQSLNAQQAGSSEQRRLSFQERSLLSAVCFSFVNRLGIKISIPIFRYDFIPSKKYEYE